MINIHDIVPSNFLEEWKNTPNQDTSSLDWLPYFYNVQSQMNNAGGPISGNILYFPTGTYFMSATLHILRSIHIVGEGIGNSVLSIHSNKEFVENGNIVPQDGIIFHTKDTSSLIGKKFKKFVPPFPSSIPEVVQKGLLLNTQGNYYATAVGATIEKVTIDGNKQMRHGVVEHIGLVTIQDSEIRDFQDNGIHIYAHVAGGHDLSLLYGGVPLSSPNANHPDASHPYGSNSFNIQQNLPVNIDITAKLLAYLKAVLKENGVTDNNIPNDSTLLTNFFAQVTGYTATGIKWIDLDNTGQNFILIYEGFNTAIGSQTISIQYTGNITYLINGIEVSANFNPDIKFQVTLKIFHEDYNYPLIYTNASTWKVFRSTIRDCGGHGLYTFNLDANAGMAQAVSCINNDKFGFYDDSNLGNTYLGCYAAGNGEGNYWSGLADSGVNVSYFIGCHSDNLVPSRLGEQGVVIGGSVNSEHPLPDENQGAALILKDSGTFDLKNILRFLNYNAPIFKDAKQHSYLDFGHPGERTLLAFHQYDVEEKENGTLWQIMLDDGNDTWNYFTSKNSPAWRRINLASAGAKHNQVKIEEGSIHFEFGYYLAANNNEDNFIKVNAYEPDGSDPSKPKMSSLVNDLYGQAITDDSQEDNDRYPKKGDILFNSAPNSGEYSGWICVKDYISSEIREEWKPFGLIES